MKNDEIRPARGSILGEAGDEHSTADAVRSMFAAVAPRYDFLNHFLSLGTDILWRRATARSIRNVLQRPGSIVADLCCGTGDLSLALTRHSAGTVIGVDFCHPMLVRARTKGFFSSKVRFVEADSLRLPFADGSLDGVTIAFGFRNLSNYQKGLEELLRVLRPGGQTAILEFSRVHWPIVGPAFRFYFRRILPLVGRWISSVPGAYQYLPDSVARFPDQESLAEAMRSAGFVRVRYRNFTGGAAALHLGEKSRK